MIAVIIAMKMAAAIYPGAEHTKDAHNVIQAVAATANNKHDAAMLLIQAWRESSFDSKAIGDKGEAFGAWQLHRVPPEIINNVRWQARIALSRIHYSETMYPQHPLAIVASGNNHKGTSLSDRRMQEVYKIEHAAEK